MIQSGADIAGSIAIVRQVKGCCPLDCQDTCAWIAHVADGRVVRVEGAQNHPFTRGVLCAKVNDYEQRTYADDRWSALGKLGQHWV